MHSARSIIESVAYDLFGGKFISGLNYVMNTAILYKELQSQEDLDLPHFLISLGTFVVITKRYLSQYREWQSCEKKVANMIKSLNGVLLPAQVKYLAGRVRAAKAYCKINTAKNKDILAFVRYYAMIIYGKDDIPFLVKQFLPALIFSIQFFYLVSQYTQQNTSTALAISAIPSAISLYTTWTKLIRKVDVNIPILQEYQLQVHNLYQGQYNNDVLQIIVAMYTECFQTLLEITSKTAAKELKKIPEGLRNDNTLSGTWTRYLEDVVEQKDIQIQ